MRRHATSRPGQSLRRSGAGVEPTQPGATRDLTGFEGLRETLHPLSSARLSGAQACSVGSGRLRWAELEAEVRARATSITPRARLNGEVWRNSPQRQRGPSTLNLCL
jgi:hypothetical protein